MIYTARQLEDLHKVNGNGQLVLPYGARLTPLAVDWAKARKVTVGFGNVEPPQSPVRPIDQAATQATPNVKPLLWWCDGPCGAAKAALAAQAKESALSPMDVANDGKQIVKAIKHLAAEVKAGRAAGGVLLVQTGAVALLFANRCPSLRAVLGTCLEAVEQGVQQVAANVLVVEYPYKTLMQVKNVLGRFARGRAALTEDVQRQLQELTSCG